MDRIPVSGPWITDKEIRYVTEAVSTAWYGNANVFNERFERAFAAAIGVRHAIALPSCTSAIHLSLLACGVGPGDEVIVPECTWIATSAPIDYVGATPVFADIDARTWCLSAAAFEAAITPRTKAVIPVDLYGNMADVPAIRAIARRRGIRVIEDAAEAVGSRIGDRQAGSFGDTGVFSFHGSKTLTTHEGGMLVTDDEAVHQRALVLRDHGRAPGDRMFFNREVGFKYKMSSMQAALGLAQLERLAELVQRKREIFAWYRQQFADIPWATLNHEAPGTHSTYWMVTAVIAPDAGIDKVELMDAMSRLGIDCRPFFHPLSSLPAYADRSCAAGCRERNPASYAISPRAINLPSGFNMTPDLVKRVVDALKSIVDGRHAHR